MAFRLGGERSIHLSYGDGGSPTLVHAGLAAQAAGQRRDRGDRRRGGQRRDAKEQELSDASSHAETP